MPRAPRTIGSRNDLLVLRPSSILKGVSSRMSELIPQSERDRWEVDPVRWCTHKLRETVWSKQGEILTALAKHDKVAVRSGHGLGKSYAAASAINWWIDQHIPGEAFIVTTAPTYDQVRAVLWREVRRLHAKHRLPGRVNQTEMFQVVHGQDELVGYGRRPTDINATDAMQGTHAPFLLGVIDEACGVPDHLWEAFDAILSNEGCKLLAIGNPTDTLGEFYRCFEEDSGFHCVHISCLDSPNVTGEEVPAKVSRSLTSKNWIADKKKRWGEDSHRYISRVTGEFPPDGAHFGFYPISFMRSAMHLDYTPIGEDEKVLGVDVGGGIDSDIIYLAYGATARIVHEAVDPDKEAAGKAAVQLGKSLGADRIVFDSFGIGADAYALCRSLLPSITHGVNTGDKCLRYEDDRNYFNIKAQLHDMIRNDMGSGDLDIDMEDDELLVQLERILPDDSPDNKIKIQSKRMYRKKWNSSPDRVDALVLTRYRGLLYNPYATAINIKKGKPSGSQRRRSSTGQDHRLGSTSPSSDGRSNYRTVSNPGGASAAGPERRPVKSPDGDK